MNIKELHPDRSPEEAFGARVRLARRAKGWKQEQLARELGYSSTHVSGVETGRKFPTLRFARNADRVFGTMQSTDSFERQQREIRNGSLLEGFAEYVELEARAEEIRLFEIGIIPGLLQTAEYATVIAENDVDRGAITEDQAQERIRIIADRQAAIARELPPLISAMLDESCIRRPIGGPGVMRNQFEYLIEFAKLPNTAFQIAPYEMGVRRGFDRQVTILTMPDRSVTSYAESAQRGYLERESTFVLPAVRTYHQVQAEASSQVASVALVNKVRKGMP